MSDSIRVLVADDHTIVRSGVRLLLEAEPGIDVVGEALDGREAIEKAAALKPDVILMDISMPEIDGLEATRQIKNRWPEINILVLTMHRTDDYFFEMLKAGASGYVLKGAETEELIQAVRVVGRGEIFLYPTVAGKLVQNYLSQVRGENDTGDLLSPREKEIMQLLVKGFSNKEIAQQLFISSSTVYSHRGNLMSKLGLSNRHELIEYARRNGLIHDY